MKPLNYTQERTALDSKYNSFALIAGVFLNQYCIFEVILPVAVI